MWVLLRNAFGFQHRKQCSRNMALMLLVPGINTKRPTYLSIFKSLFRGFLQ